MDDDTTRANVFDFNTAARISDLDARRKTTVEAEDIRERLHASAQSFVEWLFSGRALIKRGEARIGDVTGQKGSSLAIQLTGPNAGLWFDHSTEERGDLITLYMRYMGYSDKSFSLALQEIASEFFNDPVTVERSKWQPSASERIVEKKQKLGDKPHTEHLELGAPVTTWKYWDLEGNQLASVIRYEPDGTAESKTYRPHCYKTVGGVQRWVKGTPEIRPLYNWSSVVRANSIVLVEGEKCAQALIDLGITATTAMMGASAPVDRTDWSALYGKTVTIWPDNDETGFKYARAAMKHLAAHGCRILLCEIPAGVPDKWDCADCIAEGGDVHTILNAAVPMDAVIKPRIQVYDLADLEALPPVSFIIEGVLVRNGIAMGWGASGSLKSFAILEMGLCVSTGHAWHGIPVQAGAVLYVAAEGATGLAQRALGWWRTRGAELGLPEPRFKLIPHPVSLTSDDLDAMLTTIAAMPDKPSLIILDTLARTFGLGDESRTMDMNAYVSAVDRLRVETGATILIVHHSGKSADTERGSSVLRGAADTIFQIKRNGDKVDIINRAPNGKQKDAEEFETVKLRTQVVSFKFRDTQTTTLVLMPREDTETEGDDEGEETGGRRSKKEREAPAQKAMLKLFVKAGHPLGLKRLRMMIKKADGSIYSALDGLVERGILKLVDQPKELDRLWELTDNAKAKAYNEA